MTAMAGGIIYASDVSKALQPPIGRLIAQSVTVLADNVQVPIPFGTGSTDFDTGGFHSESTNNTRVTPKIPGYYLISGTGFFEAETTPVVADVDIRKNGTANIPAAWRYPGATQAFSGFTQVRVHMDGVSDYFELMLRQDSAGSDNTNVSSQFSSVLEWELIWAD